MKRLICTLAGVLFFLPSSALAQSTGNPVTADRSTTERPDFSAAAAGVELMAAADVRPTPDAIRTPNAESRAPRQNSSRSFWRSPWPWVIGGGAVVVVLVASRSKGEAGVY